MGDAKTFSAAAPDAFAASMAAGISSASGDPINRKLDAACARRVLQCLKLWCVVVLESARAAMRRSPGTASIRISCRLPSSSVARMLIPVVLPPGRASEFTSPDPTIRR